jgi:hypothetical protein
MPREDAVAHVVAWFARSYLGDVASSVEDAGAVEDGGR